MKTYKLPIAKAIEALVEFNQEFETMVADYLVYKHFLKIIPNLEPEKAGAGAILIDKLWNTNIRYSVGDMVKIFRVLDKNSSDIERGLARLGENDLLEHPDKIIEVARELFPLIIEDKKKKPYSFTTKFFHWITQRHLPVVDKNARKSIRRFQEGQPNVKMDLIQRQESFDSCEECLDDYEKWVYFYSNLLRGISEDDKKLLMKTSGESKYPQLVVNSSLLRLLDKIFWKWGEE